MAASHVSRGSPVTSHQSPVVAVDVGGTNTRVALVTRNRVVEREQFPTGERPSPGELLGRIGRAIDHLLDRQPRRASSRQRLSVVIGLPGLIDAAQGQVLQLPNVPGWEGVRVARLAQRRFRRPVLIDNDVNLMGLAEHRFGAGRGAQHLVCLTLGTGVGGALILNGQLYRGAHGASGEVGHMPLNRYGDRCLCGGFGCLERAVGNRYLMERMDQRMNRTKQGLLHRWVYRAGRPLTPELIDEAVRAGDEHAIRFWQEIGAEVGTTLTGIANLLDLERIVIGGGIARAGRVLFDAIRQMIRARAMRVQRRVEVVPAQLGTDAGLIGGWCLVHREA